MARPERRCAADTEPPSAAVMEQVRTVRVSISTIIDMPEQAAAFVAPSIIFSGGNIASNGPIEWFAASRIFETTLEE